MSVDDVWASMQKDAPVATKNLSLAAMLAQAKGEKRKGGMKKVEVRQKAEGTTMDSSNSKSDVTDVAANSEVCQKTPREPIEAKEILLKLTRNVDVMTNSEDSSARKHALVNLHKMLFEEYRLTDSDYSVIFREIAKPIFKRFADPIEKCRELALKLTQSFFDSSSDLVLVLGYFIPALMQRIPSGITFDEDMKVFVFDKETHEAYRRGKAVDRQDKGESLQTYTVIEASEELRLIGCVVLATLIRKMCRQNAASVLHPYFFEIIIFLQTQFRDPFPETKIAACATLEFMATVEEYNTGLKFFAVGLSRAILPILRHKHAKVRIAALGALKACISVPDRAKLRGAGTEAIQDLVGFREENVLNVAAFYKSDVQINYLAEIVQDKSVQVREKLVEMLTVLLTEIGDRYDHQTRLLPYLLDLLTDEASCVAEAAMRCMKICGKQYEDEHYDEIIERRQYGVDGDNRINLDKQLPKPFTERPRIGMRLYVRGNTKRFLMALVNELTNWVSQTRIKSANLLKMIVVLCEEHLTMEAHTLLPAFIKALGFSKQDGDNLLHSILLEVYELFGRYILPETYVHYILPRLTGDPSVTQFGVDSITRISVMECLGACLDGSKSSELIPHFEAISGAITDPFVISPDSTALVSSAMSVIPKMLVSMRGKGNAAIQAHFLATGRLTSLKGTISKLFNWFLAHFNNPLLCNSVLEGIVSLSLIESDSAALYNESGFKRLFDAYSHGALLAISENYELNSDILNTVNHDYQALSFLVENPFHTIQRQSSSLTFLLNFICSKVETLLRENHNGDESLISFNDLLLSLFSPMVYRSYPARSNIACSCLMDFLLENRKSTEIPNDNSKMVVYSSKSKGKKVFLESSMDDEILGHGVTDDFIPKIIELFVLHPKWSMSQPLQTARLDLLAALVGFSTPCLLSVVEENLHRSLIDCNRLLSIFPAIIDKVMEQSKFPGNAQHIRLASVEITAHGFALLNRSWYPKDDFSSLLKSFEYWSMEGEQNRPVEASRRIEAQRQAQEGIAFLVKMLNDGSDEVRLASLQALNNGVGLVMAKTQIDSNPTLDIAFEGLVSTILRETAVTTNNEEFFETLDQTLRSLAVLSPAKFESLLRIQLEASTHLASSSPGLQIISDLFSHCEILGQLRKF